MYIFFIEHSDITQPKTILGGLLRRHVELIVTIYLVRRSGSLYYASPSDDVQTITGCELQR